MFKKLLLMSLSFLLSSCFYYDRAERYFFRGYIDGKRSNVEKYDLVYLFNGDTAFVSNHGFYYDRNLERKKDGHITVFGNSYCNVAFRAGDVMGCPNSLRGIVNVEIYLKNKKSQNSYLLAKKTVDMGAHYRAEMRTQVYIGSDSSLYEKRTRANIEWNRMEPLVLKNDNDTIYHYTIKYWEKREKEEDYANNYANEKYFVEDMEFQPRK